MTKIIPSGSFSNHITQTTGKISLFQGPFYLQFHPTNKCYMNCSHCYQTFSNISEMNLEQSYFVINKFYDFTKYLGMKGRVQISGGEPLLYPHIVELVKYISKKAMDVRILSSGLGLNQTKALQLKKAGCSILQLSIEGGKKVHETIRGKKAFEIVKKALINAHSVGLSVTISFTVSKLNLKQIKNVINIGEKYFAHRLGIQRFIPVGTGEQLKDQLLTKQQIIKLFNFLNKLKTKKIKILKKEVLWAGFYSKKFDEKLINNYVGGCSAGYHGITIESDGSIMPCRRMNISWGNIFKDDLIELFFSDKFEQLRNRNLLKGKCFNCKLKWICGGCRAIPAAVSGDYFDEDFQCPF